MKMMIESALKGHPVFVFTSDLGGQRVEKPLGDLWILFGSF